MTLEKTWRWFGPTDPVTLDEIRQTGAHGIVTSLHQIPVGEIWQTAEIMHRKTLIENAGLTWSVVESLPVHENIKKRRDNFKQLIENYKISLLNLSACGIDTVCYNFMPVLDWSRTNMSFRTTENLITTAFNYSAMVAFDLFILKRKNVKNNYSDSEIDSAQQYFRKLSRIQIDELTAAILLGFPGSLECYRLSELARNIDEYREIDTNALRSNLGEFIQAIFPTAQQTGIRLAIHTDDPPFDYLGLPRVVSNKQDIGAILAFANGPENGLTLCTGSLGSSVQNDIVDITDSFKGRINFIHLRNVIRTEDRGFVEALPFEGDIDLYQVLKILILEQNRRIKQERSDFRMPMRVDHGHLMSADLRAGQYYPGYSYIGRLRNLAELRGMELGICRALEIT